MQSPPDPQYRHRFPAEIICHAVWLYHVFSLSLWDVERHCHGNRIWPATWRRARFSTTRPLRALTRLARWSDSAGGTSICNTSSASDPSQSSGTCAASTSRLAPPASVIAFSPPGVTAMQAKPEGRQYLARRRCRRPAALDCHASRRQNGHSRQPVPYAPRWSSCKARAAATA